MSQLNLNVAEVVANYPAYKVVQREVVRGGYFGMKYHDISFTDIVAFEKLGLKGNGYFSEFEPGSVVSYALKNAHDPIEAIEQANKNHHEFHWINACATVITSHERPQVTFTLVEIGMIVRFEGLLFTIEKAPNNNLRLKPYQL
jgi:hypothetical protein